MLPWDKKKTASHIVGRLKPDGTMSYGGEVRNEEGFGSEGPGMDLARQFLAAIKSDSPSGIRECLKLLISEIQDEDRKEDDATYQPKE